ncbi:MAG: LysM peptidoglycan-binding domain-containing M23 family metallopeptidase [Actinomycetota bacterium]|nr:LysM peptidoglycan-binding domain-containing M23 family metallopeptidase [Actinomycetota bacterium]
MIVATLMAIPFVGGREVAEGRAAAVNCPAATYTVVSGDSWYKIANKLGTTPAALTAANNATISTMLHPGMVLCVPSGSNPAPTTTAASATTTPPVAGKVTIKQFPVQGTCYFTDTYGAPRSGGRAHEGVDIIASSGKYLYAVDDGTLTKQYIDAPGTLAGNGWRLTRADGTYFFYAHLSAFAPGLKVGSTVKAGQILGNVGMTGNAGTPHLHFEVHPGGGASVNPTPTVKAVDGCKVTAVPPQPGAPATTSPPTTTTAPKPTVPPTTVAPPPTTAPTPTTPTTAPATVPTTPPGSTPTSGLWSFIAPVKALDTGGAKLTPGGIRRIAVAGLTGVPAGTTGLMARISVRNVATGGYLVMFACDGGVPPASTLNYNPGKLNATMTMVKVVAGEVCVLTSTAVDVRIDAVAVLAAQGVGPQAIVTKRALDTRSSTPIPAGGTRSASIASMGAPSGSKAVTVSVTVIGPVAAGSIGIGPCGGTPWIVPFAGGSNQVMSGVIRTNDAGVCISVTEQAHVVLDVTAVWTGSKSLLPVTPKRLFDSRTVGMVTSGGRFMSMALPAGVTQAELTVALLGSSSNAALFVWNCADKVPTAAAAYTPARSNNSVTITLNVAVNALCLSSTAPVHVLIDLAAAG